MALGGSQPSVAPWQPDPEPAVQPKQWLSHATGRPVSSDRLQ